MDTVTAPHRDSVLRAGSERELQLKARMARWSGAHPPNSLVALEECLRAPVARAEIDVRLRDDGRFVVRHDPLPAIGSRPPALGEALAILATLPGPTILELDLQDLAPMPWARAEELAGLIEPVRHRVVVTGRADWNLGRLLEVDPELAVGFDPMLYLDSLPEGAADPLDGVLALVPGACEAHLRLAAFERMVADGSCPGAGAVHRHGMLLDVWTLDAGTPGWRDRLAQAVAAGVDVITTDTPRALARAEATLPA